MDFEKLRKTYNRISGDYTKNHAEDTWDDDFIDLFLKELPEKAIVLDLGCGPGTDSAKLAIPGHKLYGIDLSDELIKIASKQLPDYNFVQGNMTEPLPFENNFFDGVFSKASLLHIPKNEIQKVFAEIIRVLKRNGVLHVAVKKGTGEKSVVENDYGYAYERKFYYWQPEELKKIFIKNNFELLKENEYRKPGSETIWLKFLLRKK